MASKRNGRPADAMIRADLDRRRSGAAGVHNAAFLGRQHKAAGKASRVGSRSARDKAAARDGW